MRTKEFNTHFLEHKAALFGYIFGLVKNREEAEDVLQELYLKLWRKKDSIKKETCRCYFYSGARSLSIDALRKIKRTMDLQFSVEYEMFSENTFEKQELTMHFRRAIDNLPGNYREVIYLVDVCMMNTAEVVDLTGLKTNNVRVILSRARNMIKEELTKIYSYERTEKS
ncbi:RNA polymerase sigma factor [Saccharicrinis sp. FJH54]|uniref:RNA polymerase sigma factor n=1 Tax=Saccharicrinis sp. FJH54 TaxID=3344665 RepID=UPI0035D3E7A6